MFLTCCNENQHSLPISAVNMLFLRQDFYNLQITLFILVTFCNFLHISLIRDYKELQCENLCVIIVC